jgi:hypothetical protein
MSENKFLKNLSQQINHSQAVEPTPPQPVSLPQQRQQDAPTEYDSIKRLADEMSRHSRAIEGLCSRIDRIEQQPEAATQADLQILLTEARKGVRFTMNSEEIAGFVLPELKKGMPTPASIKAAADAAVSAITAAGTKMVERIERAGLGAAGLIERASRSKADAFAGRVGFSSWQAAAVVFAGFALLVVLVSVLNRERETALAQARSETQGVREFTDWVKTQPQGKRLYERYYNP